MALSGQKTVSSAGTAVLLGNQAAGCALRVQALAGNTGVIYLGNDGSNDVAGNSGLELAAGDFVVFDWVSHLGDLYIDASVSGEGVCWLLLDA
jgi:hypothetical protein